MTPPRPEGAGLRVRPYALTGGRTRPQVELGLETIIVRTASGDARSESMPMERGDILRLCHQPISLAEISAHLHLPLGVARVLVGDLCEEGHLDFDREHANGERPSLRLLERVFDGLQAL